MEAKRGQSTTASVAALIAAAVIGSFATVGPAGRSTPAGAYQYGNGKVTICHHAKGKRGTKHVTIRVSRNALPAHLRHGDTVGACSAKANRAKHSAKGHTSKFHKQKNRKGKRGKG